MKDFKVSGNRIAAIAYAAVLEFNGMASPDWYGVSKAVKDEYTMMVKQLINGGDLGTFTSKEDVSIAHAAYKSIVNHYDETSEYMVTHDELKEKFPKRFAQLVLVQHIVGAMIGFYEQDEHDYMYIEDIDIDIAD